MYLTSNFFVLCKNMKVYLYKYSYRVKHNMIIHKGKGEEVFVHLRYVYQNLMSWSLYTFVLAEMLENYILSTVKPVLSFHSK